MVLKWYIFLAAACLFVIPAYAAEPPELVQLPPAHRQRVVDRPLVFPRIRNIYNLHQNPYQNFNEVQWIDRPLLHDRSLADLDAAVRDLANNQLQLQLSVDYGVNGLSMLYHGSSHLQRFLAMFDAADKQYERNHNQILLDVIGQVLREGPEKAADVFEPVLRRYLESPAAARLGDKVIVGSYSADDVSPAHLARFIQILKNRCGDRFLFMTSIGNPRGKRLGNWPTFQYAFEKYDHRLPADELGAVKAYVRSYLDVSDGILMNNSNHLDTRDNRLDAAFYEQFVVRLYNGILSEPAYQGKLLGLSASLGYINPIAGGTQLEDGTMTLRKTMQIALDAPADVIVMPEWNELNENTNLEPTVDRGYSTKRILRYIMAQAGGKQNLLTPLPGDDVRVPNLIISARASQIVGEVYDVELLNVPDGSDLGQSFYVDADVCDQAGQVVHQVRGLPFTRGQLTAQHITIPTEKVANCRVLKPQLTIHNAQGHSTVFADGMPITRLTPSWNTNLISLKQPLRDLLPAESLRVEAAPSSNGMEFRVEAQTQDDLIRHLEILEDDLVVYSHDAAAPYQLNADDMVVHLSYSSKKEINPFPIKIAVTNGEIRYFQDRLRLGDPRESKNLKNGAEVLFNWKSNVNRRGGILVISNKQQAVLDIQTPVGEEHIPLSRIASAGSLAVNLPQTVAIRVDAADYALDIPVPIRLDHVSFTHTAKPCGPGGVYRVRLITMSGKSITKGPFMLPLASHGQRVTRNVLSETTGTVETVEVDSVRLPQLKYDLTGSTDMRLRTNQGERWTGTKGQGWSYGGAFASGQMPGGASLLSPQTVIEDAAPALLFDGQGDYLHFPSEVIPARSGFTIEMEIKPLTLNRQYLIHSQNAYPGTVDMMLDGGKIVCTYRGQMSKDEKPYFDTVTFASTRSIKVNEWTHIKLAYDLKRFELVVGDDAPVQVAYSRPAWWRMSPFTFGGWGENSALYYHGYLRSLTISH